MEDIHENRKREQYNKPDRVDNRLNLPVQRFATNPLDKRQHDFTAVQRGKRQQIHDRNVRRQYARN